MSTPDPTFTEALTYLQGSLPDDPELDDRPKRALRVVVGELRSSEAGE